MDIEQKQEIVNAVEQNDITVVKVPLNSNLVRKLKAIGVLFENEIDSKDAKKENYIIAKGIEKSCDSFDLVSIFSKKWVYMKNLIIISALIQDFKRTYGKNWKSALILNSKEELIKNYHLGSILDNFKKNLHLFDLSESINDNLVILKNISK